MGGNVSVESEVGVGTKFHIVVQLKAIDKIPVISKAKPELSYTENFKRCFRLVPQSYASKP